MSWVHFETPQNTNETHKKIFKECQIYINVKYTLKVCFYHLKKKNLSWALEIEQLITCLSHWEKDLSLDPQNLC